VFLQGFLSIPKTSTGTSGAGRAVMAEAEG